MSTFRAASDITFVNTPKEIASLVDWVTLQDTSPGDLQPPLYIDLEGERLSRDGTVSLLTVLVYPGQGLERLYLIDIHTLGKAAFSTVGSRGKSLKDILESPKLLKVFFDVRNDSDALHAHYGIKLQGVRDVQLMESATRATTESRRFISGLAKCIEEVLHRQERVQWRLCKDKGERLWNPEKEGSYSVFNIRPPSNEIVSYCVGDVKHLPALYQEFHRVTDRWRDLIAKESQNRVSASQEVGYLPHGTGRASSPWSPDQNRMLDSWTEVNPRKEYFGYDPFSHNDNLEIEEQFWDDWDTRDDSDDWDARDDNDYEDWTRAEWQGPPS